VLPQATAASSEHGRCPAALATPAIRAGQQRSSRRRCWTLPLWQSGMPSRFRTPRTDGSVRCPPGGCGGYRNRAGIPAFLLTAFVAQLVDDQPAWATAVAVAVFASCGVYQRTPLKARCLKHCRSPLSLLHYGAYRGPLRDVRAGAHHGAYCLGCCWSLMALFVVVGVMNLAAMVALAAVVLTEKLWVHGELLARVVGVAALALAVAVIWVLALAPAR
jgi:hypothetical protein